MEYLFGYQVDARIASRLHSWWLKAMFDPVTFATEPEEVQPLSVLINWDRVCGMTKNPVVFDPCAGHNSIISALSDELPRLAREANLLSNDIIPITNYNLLSNDINTGYATDFHFDIVDPEQWPLGPAQVDIILASVECHPLQA